MTRQLGDDEVLELMLEAGLLRGAGRSMLPLIRPGDTVRFAAGAYTPGDVLLCRTPSGGAVVHRLLRLDGDHVILRGDGNPRPDPPLPRAAVLGRVTAVHRGRRTIDLTTPAARVYGLAMIALTPAAPALHAAVVGSARAGARLLTGPLSPLTRRLLPAPGPPRRMPPDFLRHYLAHRGARADAASLAEGLAAGTVLLVASHDPRGALAAVAEARIDAGAATLQHLWVHPLLRRRGLGTSLVREVAAWSREHAAPLTPAAHLGACRTLHSM